MFYRTQLHIGQLVSSGLTCHGMGIILPHHAGWPCAVYLDDAIIRKFKAELRVSLNSLLQKLYRLCLLALCNSLHATYHPYAALPTLELGVT